MLFKGGWADLEYWSGDIDDPPILEAPGWEDWLDLDRLDPSLSNSGEGSRTPDLPGFRPTAPLWYRNTDAEVVSMVLAEHGVRAVDCRLQHLRSSPSGSSTTRTLLLLRRG